MVTEVEGAHSARAAPSEAEDAVQESWIRLCRTDVSGVQNLRAWLTTIVARGVSTETFAARLTSTKMKKSTSPPSRPSFAKPWSSTVLAVEGF